jgi:hypothetical protein
MTQYPDLIARAPAMITGVLYRDTLRGRDDVTILVAWLNWREIARRAVVSGEGCWLEAV